MKSTIVLSNSFFFGFSSFTFFSGKACFAAKENVF